MKVVGIGFANFRSIGSSPVTLDLRQRINLLIGANNSGKSNVLEILRRLKKEQLHEIGLKEIDFHRREGNRDLELVVDVESENSAELPDGISRFHAVVASGVRKWFVTPFDGLNFNQFGAFMQNWTGQHFARRPSEAELRQHVENVSSRIFQQLNSNIPECHVVPQFRRIVAGKYSIEGAGIVELLSEWKAPQIGQDATRQRFFKVQSFLRELLEMDDVELDVSRTNPELIVERGVFRLPLQSYGTGIHELIILAIAVLERENTLVAIEEPEIHLHPLLQKAFLRFLVEKTTNHYVITTHSNAFLSRPTESHIIHLWLEDGETKNRVVETPRHVLQVLTDLGIRAADILQANFVIWVEGPSDRVYLKRWISLMAPDLTEGIDYSIMFYGGRLLSHLTLSRDEDVLSTEELIKLLRINQNSAILIDSDKKKGSADLNETKKRVVKECKESGVLSWVTAGREIENYLTPECIGKVYDGLVGVQREFLLGTYQKIDGVLQKTYKSNWRSGFAYSDNKPAMARRFVGELDVLPDRLDLKVRLRELIQRIRAAN